MSSTLRIFRKLLTWRTVGYGLLTVLASVIGFGLFFQSTLGNRMVAGITEQIIEDSIPTMDIEIGGLDTLGWNGLEISDTSISIPGEQPLFWFRKLNIQWGIEVGQPIRIFCVLEEPTIVLENNVEGVLNWNRILPPSSETTSETEFTWPELGLEIAVPTIEIQRGKINAFDQMVDWRLDMGVFWHHNNQMQWKLHHIDVDVPDVGSIATTSQIQGDGDVLDIQLGVHHDVGMVTLGGQITSLVNNPSIDLRLETTVQPSLLEYLDAPITLLNPMGATATLNGNMNEVVVQLDSDIGISGDGTVGIKFEQWFGRVAFNEVTLEEWLEPIEPTTLNGEWDFEGAGFDWGHSMKGAVNGSFVGPVVWNQSLLNVQTQVHFNQGKVVVERFAIDDSSGRITATGAIDTLDSSASISLSSNIQDITKWLPEAQASIQGEHHIDAEWKTDTTVQINGAITAESLSDGGGFDVSTISIDSIGTWNDGALQIDNDVVATNTHAVGLYIPTLQSSVQVKMDDAGNLQINGVPSIPEMQIGDGTLQLNQVYGPFEVGLDDNGTVLQTNGMTVGKVTLIPADYVIDGGSIDLSLEDNAILADLHLLRKNRTFIYARAQADLTEGIWSIDQLDFAPTGDRSWGLKEGISFELTDGGVGNLDLQLVGEAGDIHLLVDQKNNEPDVGVTIENLDVAYVRELTNLFLGSDTIPMSIEGTIFGSIHLLGAEGRFQDDDFILLKELSSPDLMNALDVYVDIKGSLQRLQTEVKIQHDAEELVLMSVQVPLENGTPSCQEPLNIHMVQQEYNWTELHSWIPVVPELDMVSNIEARVAGTACAPMVKLVGQGDVVVGAQRERFRWEMDLAHQKDILNGTIHVVDGVSERLSITIDGETHISDVLSGESTESLFSQISVDAQTEDLYLQRMGMLLGFPNLGRGKVEGSMALRVTPTEWTAEADVNLPKVRFAKHRLSEDSGMHVTIADSVLQSDLKLDFINKGSVLGDMTYHLDTDAIFGTLDMEQVPATLLSVFITDIVNEHGKIEGSVLVDGTLTDPLVNALFQIQQLGFQLPSLGTEYENIELEASIEKGKVSIQKLDGEARFLSANPLELSSWGQFGLRSTASYSDDGIQATARLGLDEFPIVNTEMAEAVVSGSISVLQDKEGLSFSGDAYVHQASVSLGRDFFEEGASLTLPSEFRIHRNIRSVQRNDAVDDWLNDWLKTVRGNLQVDLGDRVVIHTTMPMTNDYGEGVSKLSEVRVDAELRGVLDVGWRLGEPTVLGAVTTLRGAFVTMGKEFELGEGDIVFSGADVYNPQLNLFAQKSFGEYGSVGVSVSGAVDVMELNFEAINSPYPYDQTDIVTLLLLGKPSKELANAESQTAATLIQAGLTSMSGAVGDALGGVVVDNVDWDPTEGMFRVGKTLSDTMFLSYMRNYWAEEGENVNEFTLEWLVLQRVYGELVTGDSNNTQATLYYRWIF